MLRLLFDIKQLALEAKKFATLITFNSDLYIVAKLLNCHTYTIHFSLLIVLYDNNIIISRLHIYNSSGTYGIYLIYFNK